MRIAIITNGLPLDDSPLLGLFELDQAIALMKNGIQVELLCVDLRSFRRRRRLGIESGIINGVKWHRIAFPLGRVPIGIYKFWGQILLQILYTRVWGDRQKPDIIHAHFYDMGMIAVALSNNRKIPLVITEHSSIVAKETIKNRLRKELITEYSRANRVIAVSEGLKKKIYKHTGIKALVVGNVTDSNIFLCKRKEHKGMGYIMTANMLPGKNPSLLLEAFYRLLSVDDNCFLGYIGDGVERKHIEKRVKELGIGEKVTFYGRKRRSEYSDIYAKYDCFVLPSNAETFGVVIIEALACGLPCIVTKCGGPEYIINKHNGIVVEKNNVDEMLAAMIRIKQEIKSYSSEYMIKYVENNYSERVISEELSMIYCDILKEFSVNEY